MEQAGADRIGVAIHFMERLAEQLGRSGHVVDQVSRLGGPLEQGDPVDRGEFRTPRQPRPQLQGVLVEPPGLGEGKGEPRLSACLDSGRQGTFQLPAACQW